MTRRPHFRSRRALGFALAAALAGLSPPASSAWAQGQADLPCNALCRWWLGKEASAEPQPPATPQPVIEPVPALVEPPPRKAPVQPGARPHPTPVREPVQAGKTTNRTQPKMVRDGPASSPSRGVAGGGASVSRSEASSPMPPAGSPVGATRMIPEPPRVAPAVGQGASGQPGRSIPAWLIPVAPLDDAAPARPRPSASAALSEPMPPSAVARESLDASPSAPPPGSAAVSPVPPSSSPTLDLLGGATTLVLRIGPGIGTLDDLNGRKVAIGDPYAGRQAAIAATFRSRSVTPDLVPLPSDEADQELRSGEIKAIATLADDATAAKATQPVLKLRLEPYVVKPSSPPPS